MPDDRGQYIGLRRGIDAQPRALSEVPPLTEGHVVKGGRNQDPSQIKERPAAPGAINRRNA
jgi:hypothetical protein